MTVSPQRSGAPAPPCDDLYDPLAPATLADPYAAFARLRRSGAVRWHERLASWVVTGHAECREVLQRVDVFGSDFRRIGDQVPDAALSIQMLDPPEHTGVRHLFAAAVRACAFGALADHVSAVAERRLAAMRDGEPFDFVSGVARPLALETVSHVLGVAPPDGAEFEAVSNAIVRSMDGGLDPSRVEPGRAARQALAALVSSWLAAGGDGMLGYVAEHRAEHGVGADVAANSLRAVLHAGYESASRLLGNAGAVLVERPGLAEALRDPALLTTALDEFVRYDPPVQADARACVTDVELGGVPLRRGDVVVLLLGAANRDPAAFPDPDAFRPDRRANRHLGFGLGPHACLGAQLAMVELRAVLAAICRHGGRLTLAGEPEREQTATLRGLRRLPVRWERAA